MRTLGGTAGAPQRDTSDRELIRRVRAGDETAFAAIDARYRRRLHGFARRMLGDQRDGADDIVQEALWRTHRALLRDERDIDLKPWLFRLTRNCALDELSRVRTDALPLEDAGEPALASERDEPAAVHQRRAELADLLGSIATLPSAQRHALLRSQVDGLTHAQVAAELGVTTQASRSLVVRARANLAEQARAVDERCDAIRADLLRAAAERRRASVRAYRHLSGCAACREYRSRLRRTDRALALLSPGPALIALLLGTKLAGAGGVLGGGGSGGPLVAAKAPVIAGVLATTAAIGGGTLVATSGDPSPVDVRSPVLGTQTLPSGAPIPAGTAIVRRVVALPGGSARARISCPDGMRAADLLPPRAVTAGYVPPTVPGASRTATVAVSGRAGTQATVGVLCRRPDATGSIVAGQAAAGHAARERICVAHAYLHARPGGATAGSVRRRQPVAILRERGRWLLVRTDLGHRGWVTRGAVC